jgi:hypothetical protein
MDSKADMGTIKTFLSGAFLGAAAFGALTHAAWAHSLRIATIVPALTVADVIEVGGAVASGIAALLIVLRQERHRTA